MCCFSGGSEDIGAVGSLLCTDMHPGSHTGLLFRVSACVLLYVGSLPRANSNHGRGLESAWDQGGYDTETKPSRKSLEEDMSG